VDLYLVVSEVSVHDDRSTGMPPVNVGPADDEVVV
jgi:hypothetical protein